MPRWVGNGFMVGDRLLPVLSYQIGDTGWNDDLAELVDLEVDEHRPIGRASRGHAVAELARWLTTRSHPVLLEVGCATGFMVKTLRRVMPDALVVGAEYALPPLQKLAATTPDVPLVQLDLVRSPLPDNTFDGIVALNVLEHIEEDFAAMQQMRRMLRPRGIAVIEVPAMPGLYDAFDRQVGHFRRYDIANLTSKLRQAGLEILSRSHLGLLAFPAFWIGKRRNQRLLKASEEAQQAAVLRTLRAAKQSSLLQIAFDVEAILRPYVYFPVGIRCLVTCRKPADA